MGHYYEHAKWMWVLFQTASVRHYCHSGCLLKAFQCASYATVAIAILPLCPATGNTGDPRTNGSMYRNTFAPYDSDVCNILLQNFVVVSSRVHLARVRERGTTN